MRGSSPRVRGTRSREVPCERPAGIIPACAGNTANMDATGILAGDHPRVCGEHSVPGISRCSHMGSSPRVRGTPATFYRKGGVTGIIPACAGNTREAPSSPTATRDHPRVCGEHRSNSLDSTRPPWIIPACAGNTDHAPTLVSDPRGSSPRVRGTRGSPLRGAFACGIIPACAGNTGEPDAWSARTRDHPRVCGEHPT